MACIVAANVAASAGSGVCVVGAGSGAGDVGIECLAGAAAGFAVAAMALAPFEVEAHVVAVEDLGAAFIAENAGDFTTLAPYDAPGVL